MSQFVSQSTLFGVEPPTYRNILIPLDGTAFSETVLPHAAKLALTHNSVCHLVRALAPVYYPSPGIVYAGAISVGMVNSQLLESEKERDLDRAEQYLRKAQTAFEELGIECSSTAEIGSPTSVIFSEAERVNADLILIASHQRTGLSRWLAPNTSSKVSLGAKCPVLVIRGDENSCVFRPHTLHDNLTQKISMNLERLSLATRVEPEILSEAVPRAISMMLSALAEVRFRGPSIQELFSQKRRPIASQDDLGDYLTEQADDPGIGLVSQVFHQRGAWAASELAADVSGLDAHGSLSILATLAPIVLAELQHLAKDDSELRDLLDSEIAKSGQSVQKTAEKTAKILHAI